MGRKDRQLKQEVHAALDRAWNSWVADISSYSKIGIKKSLSKSSAGNENDSEYNASERQMAEDDEVPGASSYEEFETLTPFYFEDSEKGIYICKCTLYHGCV